MNDQYVPRRSLSPEQRDERAARQRVDAKQALKEHEEAQRALYANRDRLRALRLAREAEDKAR